MNENALSWFESNFLQLLNTKRDTNVGRTVTSLCRAAVNQHSCLHINDSDLRAELVSHQAVGSPGENTPLILDENRLYLSRFYNYERQVADLIGERNQEVQAIETTTLGARLDREFGREAGNRQKLAALLAITRNLAIITGGPGTGKTSTVVKILRLLLEDNPALECRLAAPTGKAAMRLALSITDIADDFDFEVKTIHRLLGMHRDGRSFRHGPDNPVSADVLIIDEASMIDLAMMHRLLTSLQTGTRLILLGDPNQLPSVDTGNVLADLCAGDTGFSTDFVEFAAPLVGELPDSLAPTRLTDAICALDKSYRFTEDSAIGHLAKTIEAGRDELQTSEDGLVQVLDQLVGSELIHNWPSYLDALQDSPQTAESLLAGFEQTRILCSRKGGNPGVESINAAIERRLETLGHKSRTSDFYTGRPIMITRNDYNLGLYNGDVGICVEMDEPDQYLVVFSEDRKYLASRLPEHETCFAMTVHKSQGSEFNRVLLILNDESNADAQSLMTRELLYTAITRARESIKIFTTMDRWWAAIARSAARSSGMTSFLATTQVTLEQEDKTSNSAPTEKGDGPNQLDLF